MGRKMKRHEKITKELMAIGVQRNDARAFARTFRKIIHAKKEALFPEIVMPEIPVPFKKVNVTPSRLRVSVAVPDGAMAVLQENPADLHRRVTGTLASRMAEELVKGSMKIEARKVNGAVEFIGTVNVIHPIEWDKY